MFSQDHPYFPSDCSSCSFYNPSAKDKFLGFFNAKRRKSCYACKYIQKCISDIDKQTKELLRTKREEFRKLQKDENYKDVEFDKKTGGVKATHVGHIDHVGEKAERFFNGMTSSDLEHECQNHVFKTGHKVVLLDESKRRKGNLMAALDMELDGVVMDIRSVTGKGWYSNIFVKKNIQLQKYNSRTDVTTPSDSLCLYFHDPKLFDEWKMKKSIKFFKYYRDNDGELLKREIKHVYCVINGEEGIRKYDI